MLNLVGGVVVGGPDGEATWYSSCEGGACMQITATSDEVIMRSSSAPNSTLTVTRAEWQNFLAGAKDGEFDGI